MSKEAPVILAIETATRAGSISLARGEQILAIVAGDAAASHSTDLLANVDEVLRQSGATLNDVELFAAASGPGSFTGLRIGLATIKSFAVCMSKPCVGISTLAAIAHAAGPGKGNTVSLLPAGRGEVFAQMFSVREDEIEPLDAAAHIPPTQVLEKYGTVLELTWAGEAAHSYREMLQSWAEMHSIKWGNDDACASHNQEHEWVLAPRSQEFAPSIARLALREYRRGKTVSPEKLRATYVRPSDAEIPKQWQHPK